MILKLAGNQELAAQHYGQLEGELPGLTGTCTVPSAFGVRHLCWSTGISNTFCFPAVFRPLIGGSFLFWIAKLHMGRFDGFTEALWTILGLARASRGTGALMWWNRVLRKNSADKG